MDKIIKKIERFNIFTPFLDYNINLSLFLKPYLKHNFKALQASLLKS